MPEIINQPNYTIKAAAVRVRRSTRTIRQWAQSGMRCRQVAGVVIIDHAELMRTYNARMKSNPNRKREADTP